MRINIKNNEIFSTVFESVTGQNLHKPITGITTDSRNIHEGDLYIALCGKKIDGHLFLNDVNRNGASAALVNKTQKNIELQQIEVLNPITEIGKIANAYRKKFDIPVIGITGSNGKTSTKELLSHVLSNDFNVHATNGNFNTKIGLSLTLLQLDKMHTISILEMGASLPGEIESLCQIAEPTHGLITNIAPAHLKGFGSMKNIAREKGALFRYLKNGTSFVNKTDEYLTNLPVQGKSITFGLTPDCDFPADIFQEKNGTLTLILDAKEIPTNSHNLSFLKNSIAASTIAVELGVGWNNIINQLQSFSPPPGRCNVEQINNITIIDDTYNANMTSSIAALDYLKAFSGDGRKIFVFGDMLELGNSSTEQHRKVGEKCNELSLDVVLTFGENTIHTNSAIQNGINHVHFNSKKKLIKSLKKMITPGDKILFKGSRGMAMESIISGVFKV